MPCRPEEEFAQCSDDSDADLRRTPRRKRAIQPEPSDAEETESEGESEEEQESEKGKGKLTRKRKVHDYVLVKSWELGERSALGEEDVNREIYETMRDLMAPSGLQKLPGQKTCEKDIALWKHARTYEMKKTDGHTSLYRCPLAYRTGCTCAVRITETPTLMVLERSGMHDAHSHDNDGSKYLKYKQKIAFHEAAKIAPQLSAAKLRRNLTVCDSPEKQIDPKYIRSLRHIVKATRASIKTAKVGGLLNNDTYGELSRFAEARSFATLLRQHNDPDDPYHLSMFEHIVIGNDIQPARQLVTLNISSPWFLLHAVRAIIAGWTFQLNMDVTFSICRHAVDLLCLGVNSMPHTNNPLCFCIIPAKT